LYGFILWGLLPWGFGLFCLLRDVKCYLYFFATLLKDAAGNLHDSGKQLTDVLV